MQLKSHQDRRPEKTKKSPKGTKEKVNRVSHFFALQGSRLTIG